MSAGREGKIARDPCAKDNEMAECLWTISHGPRHLSSSTV